MSFENWYWIDGKPRLCTFAPSGSTIPEKNSIVRPGSFFLSFDIMKSGDGSFSGESGLTELFKDIETGEIYAIHYIDDEYTHHSDKLRITKTIYEEDVPSIYDSEKVLIKKGVHYDITGCYFGSEQRCYEVVQLLYKYMKRYSPSTYSEEVVLELKDKLYNYRIEKRKQSLNELLS
jgi:hypothetical protein